MVASAHHGNLQGVSMSFKSSRDRAHGALVKATGPTFARIREDHRSASPRVQKFLDHLLEHLLDYDLNVSTAKRDTGIADNNFGREFKRAVAGLSPSFYIRALRFETVVRMLLESDVEIGRIAWVTGFRDGGTLTRALVA